MELALEAEVRAETGTGAAHRLRRQGLIPAVVYSKAGTESLSLSQHDTERLVAHAGTGRLITLSIKRGRKKEKTPVLIKEVQYNPLRGHIIHLDFQAVAMDKEITTHVPVHLTGEEKRVHDGAIIEHFLREVEVSCLPAHIPDVLAIDISGLAMGAGLHVRDLAPPAQVRIVTPADEVVVMAAAPATAAEAAEPEGEEEEEAEAAAEPEEEEK